MKRVTGMLLAAFLLLAYHPASGQKVLTLDDAASIAMQNSVDALAARNRLEDAQANYRVVVLGQRLSLRLDLTVPAYTRSLASYFDPITGNEQFFSVANTTIEGQLVASQPIAATNGKLSLLGSLLGRNQISDITGTSRDYFSNLYVSLSEPLFGFNALKAEATRAKTELAKSERDYAQAEMDITYSVTAAFYGLYRAKRNMEITAEKVSQIEKSYDTALNKFKAGLIAEVEAMELEVDLAQGRNELYEAKKNYEELKDGFKLLIGLGLDEPVDVTANLAFVPAEIDPEEAIRNVLETRADYQNAKADIDLDELRIREIKDRSAIHASINASYGINRDDRTFSGVFRNLLGSRSVTVNLSVPVFDWGKNGKVVEQAKADLKLQERRLERMALAITHEVKSAISNLQTAEARIKILGKSVEVAQKSYEIKLDRFANGAITSFELSQAQMKLTDMKMSVMSALIDYELARADLERKTLKKYH
jgi:outer membrane protein